MNLHGVPTLLMGVAVAAVLSFLVWYWDDQRAHDACVVQREIIARQVSGIGFQVDFGEVFRLTSRSPEVRAFFTARVPERRRELARVKKELESLGC